MSKKNKKAKDNSKLENTNTFDCDCHKGLANEEISCDCHKADCKSCKKNSSKDLF